MPRSCNSSISAAIWPADEDQLEGLLLKLPPAIILALLWYVFLTRGGDLFSWFSTGSLLVLTVLYCYYALPGALNGPVSTLQRSKTPPKGSSPLYLGETYENLI